MKAADVMVCAVISVRPSARVEEVASILLANRISHLFAGQIFPPPGTAPLVPASARRMRSPSLTSPTSWSCSSMTGTARHGDGHAGWLQKTY